MGEDRRWFLINASPDLRHQVENTPALQPAADSFRNSPIAGIFLTNADLDHALGLLLLRQQENPLIVYADAPTRSALEWIDRTLRLFCGMEWHDLKVDRFNRSSLREPESLGNELAFRAIKSRKSVAFELRDEHSGKTAVVAPAVGELNDALRDAINSADVVLFDGTFWSNDELQAIRPNARNAREMNHLPISDGSLEFLRDSGARRRIYMHINNTNPILMPGSVEREAVKRAGIEIAQDGLEIVL
jgi:pyrroloquinoline quinone biosynthesis protein B